MAEEDSGISNCNEDEISKVETKVVFAMSRLQKKWEAKYRRKYAGTMTHEIVEFLNQNYCDLDGDIESQVITALLSCVKNGIVCLQDNGKYRMLGVSPKMMISNCITRTIHGSNCRCREIMNIMSKINPSDCCRVKPTKSGGKFRRVKSTNNVRPKLKKKKSQREFVPQCASQCHCQPRKEEGNGDNKGILKNKEPKKYTSSECLKILKRKSAKKRSSKSVKIKLSSENCNDLEKDT